MNRPGPTLLRILACAALLLLGYEAWTLIGSVLRPLLANPQALQTDFHYYYAAAQRFSAAANALYFAGDDVIAGFAYPPPAIVPFLWMARWPLGTALLALTILTYLMLGVAMQQWFKYLRARGYAFDRSTAAAVSLIVLSLGPTYMNAVFGQVNAFVLASVVAFVRLAPIAAIEAGVVLALGAWLKLYPALLGAIGLWDRATWRAIAFTFAAGIAIVIVCLPIVPIQAYSDFLAVLDARIDKTAIHITNQSLVAFLERFRFSPELFLNWTGQQAITVSAWARIFNVLVTIGAVIVLWRLRVSAARKAAVLIALIAVIAPLGWGHTYMMVVPLVTLQLVTLKEARPAVAFVVFTCVIALMIPAGRHLPIDAAPSWMQNIVYSRYLLATMALIVISSVHVGRSTESPITTSA